MRKIIFIICFSCFLICNSLLAQESKLDVRITGRILVDAGWLNSNNNNLTSGVAVPDIRVGVKANYGAYKAKVDIGYGYSKLSLKIGRASCRERVLRLV